jgi:hypothetical protein
VAEEWDWKCKREEMKKLESWIKMGSSEKESPVKGAEAQWQASKVRKKEGKQDKSGWKRSQNERIIRGKK